MTGETYRQKDALLDETGQPLEQHSEHEALPTLP